MSRFYRKVRKEAGTSPGTLIAPEPRDGHALSLTLFEYNKEEYTERQLAGIAEAAAISDSGKVAWLAIEGAYQVEVISTIGDRFAIHPLVLEDILSTSQRPKMEDHQGYLYIVCNMLDYDDKDNRIRSSQLNIILNSYCVISFQEGPGGPFEVLRKRIRISDSRLRKHGADYLTYRVLDTVVDRYFAVLEQVGMEIESLEDELIEDPSDDTLQEIHRLKRELLFMRKSVWPMRELLSVLSRDESELIAETTEVFLRDVYDHIVQVLDTLDNFREMVSGMLDIYLSIASNRMNEVMKVLTIMASIFIPLTFIAGIYGMNFQFMPELQWRWGYPMVWVCSLVISTAMIIYFKVKKWL